MDSNRILLTDVTLTILCFVHLTFSLPVSVYQNLSYTNPVRSLEFANFVVHNETGIIYIGASNALFQLDRDFVLQEMTNTGVGCEENDDQCPYNYNKILLIDYAFDRLITCGSENDNEGICHTRSLNNIGTVLESTKHGVVPSAMLTTEAIIGPGLDIPEETAQYMYVGMTYDSSRGVPYPVSRWRLSSQSDPRFFSNDVNIAIETTNAEYADIIINYIKAFVMDNFTYFVTHQRQEETDEFVSKVNRVCQSALDFDSFTEITLECQGQNGIVYNLIQAAYVGAIGPDVALSFDISNEEVFYGVFAKSEEINGYQASTQSALCLFQMQDIKTTFFEAVAECFGRNNAKAAAVHQVNYLAGAGGGCRGLNITDELVGNQLCTAINWNYAKGVVSLKSSAVIEWNNTIPSSIIAAVHRQHTIAFVGTTQGDLVKVHILGSDIGREYERFAVGSHVLRDAEMDKDQKKLTLLTKQQLLKLTVENCGAYTTCDECIGVNGAQDGDPYCGWCTLERRCSRYDSCPMANESSRWLPYNTQCVAISNVAAYDSIPITETEQQIILTVEQLPEESSGNTYQCIFDDISPVTATKIGNMLSCTTPAASNIPKIKPSSDHATMQLYVYSTETKVKFVQRDFFFYECNTHMGCVACTNSSWACDWCIYSNKCTHNNSTCSEADDDNSIINGIKNPEMALRQGPEECPQLAAQDGERLLPVGVSRSITVTGINLPDESRVNNYKCILDIEGRKSETAAERQNNGNNITCTPEMYTYAMDKQQLNVSLTVVWNNDRELDDVFGFEVTLYKCEVGRPDCSRCLSDVTTKAELMCGWCKADDRCTVSSKCSGVWISSDSNENCPDPVLSGVWPPSGPPNGNTVIAVMGSDVGQRFTDVISVYVGDNQCSTDGLFELYKPGSSVSCRTPRGSSNVMESIHVTINGADGSPQSSTGEVLFTYRNPSISSFEPTKGPAAGGTMVTITGQYLDACSEISATIGSECIMNRMDDVINATTARCRTTSSPVGSSHNLIISFDERTEEQSPEEFTYKPNPTVSDVQPQKTIESGGITFQVSGRGFQLAQTPQIVVFIGDEQFTEDCEIHNDTMMQCKTPNVKSNSARRKRSALGEASFGFIIGNVTDLLSWSDDNNVTLEYFEDPVYYQLETNPKEKSGDVETIMGKDLDVASSEIDVTVYIGTEKAITTSLAETVLTIELPKKNPGRDCINGNRTDYPCVIVQHGNLEFVVGTIRYPSGPVDTTDIVIGIAVACSLLIITLVIVMILYQRKVRGHEEDIGKLVLEMKEMESNIAADIREAFVQLQTDVTDLTSDLEGTGMPFVPHRKYAISMFFAGLDTRPMTYEPEDSEESVERAMLELSKLLSNKQFLMAFIQSLDEDKSVPNKDRLTIASMLTVLMILEEKLPYLTDVMITLMASQVQDAIEEGKPNRLFQRTELIIEKLLSNWIALSLYDFLKDHAAYPLFLLYRAIKCQTEKGPIDMISGKSHISLNDDNIISQRLLFETITLNVVINDEDGEKKEVKVLDVDSVGQVKTKILDSIHRNRAYSSRMQPWQVDLEWRHGKSGHLVLQDIDVSSETETGWKRVNSIKHFSVPDGSNVALTLKQDVPNATVSGETATRYSNVRQSSARNSISMAPNITQVEEGVQLWHLVKEEGGDTTAAESERKKSKSTRKTVREKKLIREVTFPRLLGTKGTVQEYMDNMFAAILNTDDVPIGVKYIFDIFDGLAVRYGIEDEAVLHRWKSNILPLRFWQKIITNPQYIFDICQTQYVEASLSVISQAFYDAFQKNTSQVSKDASYRKILYNQEIPKYRIMVDDYYRSVTEMQRVTKSLLESDLKETCMKFTGLFSRLSTLLELHKLMTKYKSRLMEALEDDEMYERAGLPEKLEHVLSLLPSSTSYDNPEYVYQQDVTSDE